MRLLVASDLSRRSQRAMYQAAILATQHDAELVLLHVGDEDRPEEVLTGELVAARQYLLRQFEHPLFEAVPGKRLVVRAGVDAQTILEVADEVAADLIVLGEQRRRLASIFTGTTVDRVLRGSTRPVLVVHGDGPHRYRHVLAALDLEGDAEAVLSAAVRLKAEAVSILHVSDDPARHRLIMGGATPDVIAAHEADVRREIVRRVAGVLARSELPADTDARVEFGEPLPVIERCFERLRPDLVVLGTRSRAAGPLRRLVLGSVAQTIVAALPADVLVVPLASEEARGG